MIYTYAALIIILCGILNRLRGSGVIRRNRKYIASGDIFYALCLGLLLWYLSGVWLTIFVAVCTFIFGERKTWGKWVGYLCRPFFPISEEMYNERTDNFIHKIANYFIPQRKNYDLFCKTALTIRGIYFWLPTYIAFAYFGICSYFEAIFASIIIGILFPIACILSRYFKYTFEFWLFRISRGWEAQEVIYGIFQGIVLSVLVWEKLI